jgi:hypothetical protein
MNGWKRAGIEARLRVGEKAGFQERRRGPTSSDAINLRRLRLWLESDLWS